MPRRLHPITGALTPRLLPEALAAAYLALPVASMARLTVGRVLIDGKLRWDRLALDAWLDDLRGLGVPSPANSNLTKGDQALDRWLADQGDVAGAP